MNSLQLIPFYLFQKVFARKYYKIENFREFVEVYFQIPNFHKDYDRLRVKISPNHNVLFEFLNGYYHQWRAKRVDIRDIFFKVKAKVVQYIKEHRVLNKELLDLLLSWLFLKFCLRFFSFSGRCWYTSTDCENFGTPKERYTFWELMTDPSESVSRLWYVKLFEKIYPRLISWIKFLSGPAKVRINLKNEITEEIFEDINNSPINVGTPLLMTKNEIIIMRKFEFSETKEILSRSKTHKWLILLLEILGTYGYNEISTGYSTFKKYSSRPSKYPWYHGIIFRKS